MQPSSIFNILVVTISIFNIIYSETDVINDAVFGRNGSYTECGKNIRLDEETRFIFKDPDARNQPGTWPWMVSMGEDLSQSEINLRSSTIWKHYCGGSLVTPERVLTAAHCPLAVETEIRQGEIFIRAGDDNLQDGKDDANVQIIEVVDFSIHPNYLNYGFGARYSDLAMLSLAKPVKLTLQTRTICLPTMASSRKQDENLPLVVTGWGTDTFDQSGKHLYDTYVQVYSQKYCNLTHIGQRRSEAAVPDGFTSDLFCGGDAAGSEGTCHGDSGSPAVLFKPLEKRYVLKGVVSGGLTCGTQIHPNIYVRISDINILNWIYSQLGQVLVPTVTSSTEQWTEWSSCSQTCGGGTRIKHKEDQDKEWVEDCNTITCAQTEVGGNAQRNVKSPKSFGTINIGGVGQVHVIGEDQDWMNIQVFDDGYTARGYYDIQFARYAPNGRYHQDLYQQFNLKDKNFGYTIDLHNVGCKCNHGASFKKMPARHPGPNGDYFCAPPYNDAISQTCPDYNILNANKYTVRTTLHKCNGVNGHYNSCDVGGCHTNAFHVNPTLICPGNGCTINTNHPFNVTHHQSTNQVKITLSQDGSGASFNICNDDDYKKEMSPNYDNVVYRSNMWAENPEEESWLDGMTGCRGSCDIGQSTIRFSGFAVW